MRRTEIRRRTPLRAKAGLKSRTVLAKGASKKRTYRRTGPAPAVFALVFARDGGRCVRCGWFVSGQRGVHYSLHHRRPRRQGGDRRPETNLPANLITVCGSGVDGCHGYIESCRTESYRAGWLLRADDLPSSEPVLTWWANVLLDDEGRWTEVHDA